MAIATELFDLTGKVAVIFRFEPMDEDGVSLWARRPPWSTKAGFSRKLRDLSREAAQVREIVDAWHAHQQLEGELEGAREMLAEDDAEMREMARAGIREMFAIDNRDRRPGEPPILGSISVSPTVGFRLNPLEGIID